jgi:hypothetical protein
MQVDKNANTDLTSFQRQEGVFSVEEKAQKQYDYDNLLSPNEDLFSLELIQ